MESEEDDLKMQLVEPGIYDGANKAKLDSLLERHKEVSGALRADMEEWEKIAIAIEDIEAALREEE
jgi:hypothetical protein